MAYEQMSIFEASKPDYTQEEAIAKAKAYCVALPCGYCIDKWAPGQAVMTVCPTVKAMLLKMMGREWCRNNIMWFEREEEDDDEEEML